MPYLYPQYLHQNDITTNQQKLLVSLYVSVLAVTAVTLLLYSYFQEKNKNSAEKLQKQPVNSKILKSITDMSISNQNTESDFQIYYPKIKKMILFYREGDSFFIEDYIAQNYKIHGEKFASGDIHSLLHNEAFNQIKSFNNINVSTNREFDLYAMNKMIDKYCVIIDKEKTCFDTKALQKVYLFVPDNFDKNNDNISLALIKSETPDILEFF